MYSRLSPSLSTPCGRPVIWMVVRQSAVITQQARRFRDACEHDLQGGKNTQGLIEIPTQEQKALRGTLNMQVRVHKHTHTRCG